MMNEEFLSYVWAHRLLRDPLRTTEGEALVILDPGQVNHDAGPDFFNARVRIGSTVWAGNVEIHLLSSDWYRHGHQNDDKYRNIILHLVYEHDRDVLVSSGEPVPVLEMKGRFEEKILIRYQEFLRSRWWIPCANLIGTLDHQVLQEWMEAMGLERLRKRSDALRKTFVMNNYDWQKTVYITLAGGFGFHVNSLPFELLAKSLPTELLLRNQGNLLLLEALLFGQSGLLKEDLAGAYPGILKKEYLRLSQEYMLHPIDGNLWNFLRLRPRNFPTVRIAQFASFMHQEGDRLEELILLPSFQSIQRRLEVNASEYWNEHYMFSNKSKTSIKKIGKEAIHSLILNAIVPLKYLHEKLHNIGETYSLAVEMLSGMPREENQIIRKFHKLGITSGNAYQTQGLLHLKKEYCNRKRCLECCIGKALIG